MHIIYIYIENMRQMEVHTRVVAKVASQRRNCRKESVMLPGRGIANLDLWLAALHEMNEVERRSTTGLVLDFCQYGTPWKKPTSLLCFNIDSQDLQRLQRRCRGTSGVCSRSQDRSTSRASLDLWLTTLHDTGLQVGVCWEEHRQNK